MRNAAIAGLQHVEPFGLKTIGVRSASISALHVDVTRRLHRGSERRTRQPRRRPLHAAARGVCPSGRGVLPSVANYPLVTYVTDGIANAMAQAKAAAGDRNVLVHGAYTAQRALEAGVLDEVQISQIPVLFGDGRRLFEVLPSRVELEIIRVIDTPEATHIRYRVSH